MHVWAFSVCNFRMLIKNPVMLKYEVRRGYSRSLLEKLMNALITLQIRSLTNLVCKIKNVGSSFLLNRIIRVKVSTTLTLQKNTNKKHLLVSPHKPLKIKQQKSETNIRFVIKIESRMYCKKLCVHP